MLKPVFSNRFYRSISRCEARGYDIALFYEIAKLLIEVIFEDTGTHSDMF